ncbi:2-acylglycerol O-acyltransferase 2-A-like [Planococcus citri]|uniref:2-acylglycerol O-acyltransferase 2-A-like n=1 Tax=Planococcus citri TaxID=170843 RepID=UPI0031F8E7B8
MDETAVTTATATTNTDAKKIKANNVKFGPIEIDFVPFDTPLKEHLQTLSVALNLTLTICGTTIAPLLLLYVFLYTRFWWLVPLYAAWVYYDRETGFKGGRKWNWCRRSVIFDYFRDYFPSKLIKTQDLATDTNYLFVVYPHGVLSYSTLAVFGSEANRIESEAFPGVDFRIVTLDINFYCPITREYFLSLGAIGATESSIRYVLSSEPSKAVVLIAGGAAEAQLAAPGNTYRIVAARRKGFVRLALKTGASLVPVFSFGENNIYAQYQSEWLTKMQLMFKKLTGIYPAVPRGRGLLQYTFGILPNRHPINTVVGKPIAVPKMEDPSVNDIDQYHAKFIQELKTLFEQHKHKYDAAGANAELVIV